MAELGAQVLLQLSRSSTSFFFFDYDHGTKLESSGAPSQLTCNRTGIKVNYFYLAVAGAPSQLICN